ncbi:MAG: hypothetical protein J7J22_02605 [Candidatus Verstraetearchaeota archaeon]|nr:hypothetical protein [Candidatus Verstraetearchaeota archaeon]
MKAQDVMANIRIFKRKSLIYARGIRLMKGRCPFKEGYLTTWFELEIPFRTPLILCLS